MAICKNSRCKKEIDETAKFCPYCGKNQTAKKRTRRLNGAGTIYALPDGRFKAELTLGYDVTADIKLKRKRFTRNCRTRTEAENALIELKLRANQPEIAPKPNIMTVANCWEIYLKSKAHDALGKSQKNKLGYAWNRLADIAQTPIAELLLDDMQDCIDANAKTFYPAKDMKTALSHCFGVAIKREIVPFNKTQYLELPLLNETKRQPFTMDEVAKIVEDWDYGNQIAGYAAIMCYAGLRPIELFNLETSEIHFEERYMIGGSKTDAGIRRKIPIATIILPIIRAFTEKYAAQGKLICMNRDKFYRLYWEMIDRLGISELSPYSCRHTYMTELARRGIQPAIITAAGGHADYETTLKYYTHIPIEDMVEAVDKI